MKSKSLCRMMTLLCVVVLCASCEKMNLGNEKSEDGGDANVFLSVTSYEQVPFGMTRADLSEQCSRLNFLVYDKDGARIRKEEQKIGDDDFGHVSFMLAKGRYYLVVVAHSGDGNPTSTNARKIAFTNKTGYTDTFLYADSLAVGDTDVRRVLNLKRIVAMVRFVPYDAAPAQADSIRFHYTGGSGTFDATGGWGVVNSEQVQWYGLKPTDKKFDIYTIPHEGDDQVLRVKVSTYKGDRNDVSIVSDCDIVGIPVKRNHVTTCRGYIFSPVYQQEFSITIDDHWDNDSIEFYF